MRILNKHTHFVDSMDNERGRYFLKSDPDTFERTTMPYGPVDDTTFNALFPPESMQARDDAAPVNYNLDSAEPEEIPLAVGGARRGRPSRGQE